jgi:hypothetical protein
LIDPASRWIATAEHLSTEVGGEVVILNLADETYYGLPEVGALVWQLLSQPRTLAELRDAVVAEFEVEPESCEADLRGLLEELSERRLVRRADADPVRE